MARVATGHVRLLARRQSIEKALEDPRVPSQTKDQLRLVEDIRRFAFETLGLKRSRVYTTYSRVDGPYVTYLVSGAERLRLREYGWRFFPVGTFPYKGHFQKERALADKTWLERRGFDAYMRGVAAYHTPLWISDPLPSSLLVYPSGELAEIVIHELAHGTVYVRGRCGFDEGLATFIGQEGARQFLAQRFGPRSSELAAYREGLEDERRFDASVDALYDGLDALYRSTATVSHKLAVRDILFAEARRQFAQIGVDLPVVNNAVVLAHRLYDEDFALYERAFEFEGRRWPQFIALLASLSRRDPVADLRHRLK